MQQYDYNDHEWESFQQYQEQDEKFFKAMIYFFAFILQMAAVWACIKLWSFFTGESAGFNEFMIIELLIVSLGGLYIYGPKVYDEPKAKITLNEPSEIPWVGKSKQLQVKHRIDMHTTEGVKTLWVPVTFDTIPGEAPRVTSERILAEIILSFN